MKLLGCLSLASILLFGRADTEAGTIIVFGYSKHEFVVAADSRTHYSVSGRNQDDVCKIVPLTSNLLFMPVGKTGDIFVGPAYLSAQNPTWDATEVAREIVRQTGDASLEGIAKAWGLRISELINRDLGIDREMTLRDLDGGIFSWGVFAGSDRGMVVVFLTKVSYDGTRAVWVSQQLPLVDKVEFSALGKIEVIQELVADETPFAREENERWVKYARQQSPHDRDILRVIRWVKLTIRRLPQKQLVGGPIDAAELTPSRGIRWHQVKEGCTAR